MCLTDKEKRTITSPQSFSSSKQRKTTKFRTKKKIQEILQDMEFLIENNSKISEIFDIDVMSIISCNNNSNTSDVTSKNTQLQETTISKNDDPDLL